MGSNRKVLIMAGGTGGHVFPALAVAHELRRRGLDVHWLGTRRGIEAEVVPANDYPLHFIDIAGVRGKRWLSKLKAPFQVAGALWQAMAILRRLAPDTVLGMGGFASGPGGLAARLQRRPLVIHEQNAAAGTTNRILARFASRNLEAFPETLPRGEHVGNPVRGEICQLPTPAERGLGDRPRPRLLVLGGSLGALAVNRLVPAAVARLTPKLALDIRHQCGRNHVEETRACYDEAGIEASVEPFIADMAAAYGWADFVVCRAGALTVSELTAAGVGSLLIPFPAAIDDHQTRNGEWLVAGGAAVLIQQRELDVERLASELALLLGDSQRQRAMADAARALARPRAAAAVADVCQEVMP